MDELRISWVQRSIWGRGNDEYQALSPEREWHMWEIARTLVQQNTVSTGHERDKSSLEKQYQTVEMLDCEGP